VFEKKNYQQHTKCITRKGGIPTTLTKVWGNEDFLGRVEACESRKHIAPMERGGTSREEDHRGKIHLRTSTDKEYDKKHQKKRRTFPVMPKIYKKNKTGRCQGEAY